MPQTKPGSLEERLVNTVLNRHDEVDHLLAKRAWQLLSDLHAG
ncbi:hypothetical protein PY650_33750 [Rhizobium calliandrae]|uniref:Uncharacterized protein n=1 Tax=Rhizobium calliandrae TaxID=1312182 RepID=A0ABT7KP99_9HYPH|nr:hypothetical protein [Rhizobium calliandrae]